MTRAVRSPIAILLLMCLAVALVLVTPQPAHGQTLLYRWIRGAPVAEWQSQLNRVRDPDIAVDGIFGPITVGATRDFQRRAGIQVDGVVGPQTRRAMQQALAGGGGPPPNPGGGAVLQRGDTGRGCATSRPGYAR